MSKDFEMGDIVHFQKRNKRNTYCVPAIIVCVYDETADICSFDDYCDSKEDVPLDKLHWKHDCPE